MRRHKPMDGTDRHTEPSRDHAAARNGREEPRLEGKLERVSDHARGLVDELTVWVDLKIQRAVKGVRDDLEARGKQVAVDAIAIAIALVSGLFALIAAAFGLSIWVGTFWGFLIVSLALALLAFTMHRINSRRRARRQVVLAERDATSASPRIAPPPSHARRTDAASDPGPTRTSDPRS